MKSLINRVRFAVALFTIRVLYALGSRFNPVFMLDIADVSNMDENDPRWDKIFCPDCEDFTLHFLATGVCEECENEMEKSWTSVASIPTSNPTHRRTHP